MLYASEQLLPVRVPGTGYLLEAVPDEYHGWSFTQDRGKSFLQILCEDRSNSLSILEPDSIHVLWNSLRAIYGEGEESFGIFDFEDKREYMRHFHSQEARARGAEYGDLDDTLNHLYSEMRYEHLFMNALVVIRNNDGLVTNMNGEDLPATIHPVSVSTNALLDPKDVSLERFREYGGHIVAHGTYPPPPHLGDEHFTVEAVRWMLGDCPVDGPSNTYDLIPIDMRIPGVGVLRGGKIA